MDYNRRKTATGVVTTAAAYASGNVVGGLLTFADMTTLQTYGGIIQSALLKDKAGQNVPYDLFLFDEQPSAQNDKTAIALVAADLAKCIGVVPFAGIVLGAAATMGVITAGGLGLAFKLNKGTSLYGYLVTRGAPTFAAADDVSVDLITLPDV